MNILNKLNEGDILLWDIIDNPADDIPRLVYADWLEDQGQTRRANSIRYALCVDRMNKGDYSNLVEPCYWIEDHNNWLSRKITCSSDRGFIDSVQCGIGAWIAHGLELCCKYPLKTLAITNKRPDRRRIAGNLLAYTYLWQFKKDRVTSRYLPFEVLQYLSAGNSYYDEGAAILDMSQAFLKYTQARARKLRILSNSPK